MKKGRPKDKKGLSKKELNKLEKKLFDELLKKNVLNGSLTKKEIYEKVYPLIEKNLGNINLINYSTLCDNLYNKFYSRQK